MVLEINDIFSICTNDIVVFSFGVVLWELVTREGAYTPFTISSPLTSFFFSSHCRSLPWNADIPNRDCSRSAQQATNYSTSRFSPTYCLN